MKRTYLDQKNPKLPNFLSGRMAAYLLAGILSASLFAIAGCGSGSAASGTTPPPGSQVAPMIATQPASQSVPMGLKATFSVTAEGIGLHYQWKKNGIAIPGATAAAYTIPATQFSDSGTAFTVTISNSAGSITSNSAKLTITARAPQPGDLRFQQVDAASTVHGYDNGPTSISTGLSGRMGFYFSSSIGTPLWFAPGSCVPPPSNTGAGCAWFLAQYNLPNSLSSLGLSAGYGADWYSDFTTDLSSSTWIANGDPVNSPNSVITSLDLEPGDNLFAMSWIQSSQSSGFQMFTGTASPSNFPSVAASEGTNSRIITAVSYDQSGQVEYFAYGWDKDPSTIYQTKVVTADSATAPQAASQLAAQGYIITAMGGSDLKDSVILVGTRVQGDTMPRPFIALDATTGTEVTNKLLNPGYAMVGVLLDSKGNPIYLGER